jgi:hypothetical protein
VRERNLLTVLPAFLLLPFLLVPLFRPSTSPASVTTATPAQPHGLSPVLDLLAAREAADAAAAAAAAAEAQAAALRAAASNTSGTVGVDWDGIAQCETGGNWQHLGNAPDGSTYDGGLGIYHGAWTDFGGLEFASRGDLATPAEQVIVAERIYARFGLSGWGCKAYG